MASDVARTLGYARPDNAVRSFCKGASKQCIPTAGGPQTVFIIPERDVIRLIMRSRLPEAERFEEWIVGEVVPAVRKAVADHCKAAQNTVVKRDGTLGGSEYPVGSTRNSRQPARCHHPRPSRAGSLQGGCETHHPHCRGPADRHPHPRARRDPPHHAVPAR